MKNEDCAPSCKIEWIGFHTFPCPNVTEWDLSQEREAETNSDIMRDK